MPEPWDEVDTTPANVNCGVIGSAGSILKMIMGYVFKNIYFFVSNYHPVSLAHCVRNMLRVAAPTLTEACSVPSYYKQFKKLKFLQPATVK